MKKKYLLAPGPTPVPEHVALEMAQPMVHHRTPQFSKIFAEAAEAAKYLFQTKQDVMILASTGTGGMEGCVTNLFSPEDKVLVINGGKFGERWGKISESYGLTVVWHNVEWGQAADTKVIKSILDKEKEIKAIESGKKERLSHTYPVELQAITEDLNLLLESQRRQKERYRASLSDLAHALKTPLAILKSSPMANDNDAQEQLDRINSMIEHQLKRAATGGTDAWKKTTSVAPVLESILNAMKKVYHEKVIDFKSNCSDKTKFLGDKTDLMEILGNLIDNACKACVTAVHVNVTSDEKTLKIEICDDGPGVEASERKKLLQRGTRLDTYESGHGVGLAIVSDLVNDYQGNIEVCSASLGGASFIIEFKYD